MHVSRSKIPSKNLVRQRCAEGFNSGFEGLNVFYFVKKKFAFVVDKVALGQVHHPAFRFYPVSKIPDMFNTHSFKHRRRYFNLSN
jgi:hypothetical protein